MFRNELGFHLFTTKRSLIQRKSNDPDWPWAGSVEPLACPPPRSQYISPFSGLKTQWSRCKRLSCLGAASRAGGAACLRDPATRRSNALLAKEEGEKPRRATRPSRAVAEDKALRSRSLLMAIQYPGPPVAPSRPFFTCLQSDFLLSFACLFMLLGARGGGVTPGKAGSAGSCCCTMLLQAGGGLPA